ncbi:MAG: 16S rRNA (uracil(1498)-N(3))-methyltransferase [Methylococcaceae bacterium]|jgi:16S rRNA (uracil1498-N3)-methyltransferase
MRVSRLYIPQALAQGLVITLEEDSAHYVRAVLRLKQKDAIVLFNGDGHDYLSVLSEVSRKHVKVEIGQFNARHTESTLNVVVGLGISRGDRMDMVVQKAVELGVYKITPLQTERCVVQLNAEKQQQRRCHWQKIVQHASEQCGRAVLPELGDVGSLANWLSAQLGLKVFLDPYAETVLNSLQPITNTVTLLSGPEGGFTGQERELAKAAGFIPVRLGKRILRTETAALAALAAVQTLWGDFGGG